MREADIRPQHLLDEYLRLSAADARRFFADAESFVPRACPACGADRGVEPFHKDGVTYVRCGGCRTLYANPIPRPDRLGAFYRDSESQRYWGNVFFPAVAEARREKIFRPRVERIHSLCTEAGSQPHTVMDVGAGTGIFLEECRAAGWQGRLLAVEPADNLAANCRTKGFETFQGFAADAATDAAWRAQADLVVSFEVIEHVPSPEDFLRDLSSLTKTGGLVLFTGLCGNGFDILTLGARSKAVSPPHHLNFLSQAGIELLLPRCGLELVAFRTPGQLDVDIVANTLGSEGVNAAEPFLRHLLSHGTAQQRAAFQGFLAEAGLSSHMWVLARKTER